MSSTTKTTKATTATISQAVGSKKKKNPQKKLQWMIGMTTHRMPRLYSPYIPKGPTRPTQNASLAEVIPGNDHGNRKAGCLG
jgi:hypothetical protein